MRRFLPWSSQQCVLHGAWRSGHLRALLVVLGLVLAWQAPLPADPKRSSPTLVAMMDNVFVSATCRDDLTLVMALKQPSAAILTLLADAHTVMMKAGIAEQVDRKDPKFLVGTGPFKYKSHTPG